MKRTIRLNESELRNMIMEAIVESRGNGYGMSYDEKNKKRNDDNPVRHFTHKENRGKKKIKGDMNAYHKIISDEAEKGNPYSKHLKKGGGDDWAETLLKNKGINESEKALNETIRRAIRKYLK